MGGVILFVIEKLLTAYTGLANGVSRQTVMNIYSQYTGQGFDLSSLKCIPLKPSASLFIGR